MDSESDLDAYDFEIPAERIAQHPPPDREDARLLVVDRNADAPIHASVADLGGQLRAGDLLVVNATRVLPARLRGHKVTGGAAETLLLQPLAEAGHFRALVRSRGRLRVGQKYEFGPLGAELDAEIVALDPRGEIELAFAPDADPYAIGEMPLPPYIRRDAPDPEDPVRYQTTFARVPGSVAAPTAGLHLTNRLFDELAGRGIDRCEIVLHVGAGTFRPLTSDTLRDGVLHPERYALPPAVAARVNRAKDAGGRVIAVGTTSARVLESCANDAGRVEPAAGETRLFLRPGARFRVVDGLLTNFHLPRSSLLLLVAAFAGRRRVMDAYAEAMRSGYRFFSYGDAMLIL